MAVIANLLVPVATQGQERLTLEDAVRLALERNETVLIAEQSVAKAKGQVMSARSEAFPKLSLTGFYNRNWRVPTSVINGNTLRFGSTNVLNGGLSLSIPIYRGGKIQAARRAARAFEEFSEANLAVARQQTAFEAQRVFLNVLLSEELVRVNEWALKQAEAHLEQVAQFQRAGSASEYEVLRAKVQVANLTPAAITARHNRELGLLDLKRTVGMSLSAPLSVEGTLLQAATMETAIAATVEEAVTGALKKRPELIALESQMEVFEDNIRVQAGEWRPSVNLINAYQNQAQVNDLGDLGSDRFVQSYNSRLTLDFPVFDGFKSRGGVTQVRADHRAAGYTRQQRIKQIELETRQAFMRLEEARIRLWAQQETVGQAEKGLQIAETRYRTGVATQLEVFDAQVTLTQIRTSHAQALNDYAISAAGLRRAMGVIR
ncbi:MAG: TolC family protein [candidate division Zixibacteria bacterium]|nr:TolC family protein [candidate division Zixibacteria bacterium]